MDALSISGILIATVVALFLLYWENLRRNHYWKSKPIVSDQPIPIFGSMLETFLGKPLFQSDTECYRKYGKLFGYYESYVPAIVVADPELLRLIMVKDFHAFTDRRSLKNGNPYFDNALGALEGEHWREVRNIMTPSFTTGKIKGMMPNVVKCTEKCIENALNQSDKGPVDIKKLLSNLTLDIIATVAFGTEIDSQNDPNNPFVVQARKIFSVEQSLKTIFAAIAPKLASKFGIRISFADLETSLFFKELIDDIIQKRRQTKQKRNDFLQLMLDSSKNPAEMENDVGRKKTTLTETEVIAQCVLFFLAGFETTASTIGLVLYNLAQYPEIREKVLEEIDRIFETSNPIDGAINGGRYLDAVMSETLRLHPPAPRIERKANQDYPLGDTEIIIPKGMTVIIPIYGMQNDPEFFPEPEKFIPERFLPDAPYLVKPYTYMPFGEGLRSCIAKRFALVEVKLCLIMLLRKIEFVNCEETKIPLELITGSGLLQPRSIKLTAIKRET